MKYLTIGKTFLFSLLVAGQLMATAHAGGSVVNIDSKGVAIKGYDPVAYFKSGGAVEGSKQHTLEWQGAKWQFSSAANRDAFKADPDKYAPQYGGYCAVGTKMGLKIDVQPDQFKIVDNKLYINSSEKAHGLWLTDIPGFIEGADKNWPDIKHKTAADLKANLGNS